MATVTVNGQRFEVPDGANISVNNGQINVTSGDMIGNVTTYSQGTKIMIEGNPGDVRTDTASIVVKGNVKGNVNAGTSVSCGSVGNSVSAGSSVSCDDVGCNVSAGSSVTCGNIKGSCLAGGSIRRG